MAKTSKRVSVVLDNTDKVFKSLAEILGYEVLIGIPANKAARPSGQLNNATIAYIHEFGAPASNIPARPFLVPGVQKARTPALHQLRNAVKFALEANTSKAMMSMHACGTVASNSVRFTLRAGEGFAPLKPSTIANRFRQRGDKGRRKAEKAYLVALRNGWAPAMAQSAAGIKPLINTAEMLHSITYVVRKI